jgi:hypothetical protein
MGFEPELTLAETLARVATKTAPRVTEASIKDHIEKVDYIRYGETTTICIITMVNGFTVHGLSACASPENFEPEIGERYAFENAFKQLWQLEGYLLRQKLYLDGL